MKTPLRSDSISFVDTLEELRELWLREGVELSPIATEVQIQDFEQLHGLELPEDLRLFFLNVGGMRNPDSRHLRVWPLSELTPVSSAECAATGLPAPAFQCADYLIMSHVFAIHLGTSNPVFMTEGATAKVAGSFEAFLGAYLRDRDSILVSF